MKTLIVATALALVQSAAFAQQPSAASLERLLEVMQARRTTDLIIEQASASMIPRFEQAIRSGNLTAEQRSRVEKVVAAFAAKMSAILTEELSWDRMKDLTAQVYRESFTQKEVDDLIAFYETPTGKAFVEKMPIVLQKSMTLTQERMSPMMERVQAAAKEMASELSSQMTDGK